MSETHYIVDILILLTAAVITVPLFQRLGLGAVLGFLVAGALVGPWGLGFIVAVDEIRHLAEFGVVFLLFIIGIELKPSRLWVMRRSVFGLGTAQVLVTGAVITLLALASGVSMRAALVAGFGLALSSTAFGLQILSEKGELGTAYGRSAFAILLLQDLAVVPLIALLPLLADEGLSITQDVELAALESVLIIVGVFVLGRLLLRPILQLVAESRRNPEIFTAAAILLVLGTAWLTEWAGLSMALGAFLGGLLLADFRYRHQIMADIQPFRGLLLGLFFMSVGMSINFGLLGRQGVLVAALVGGLLLLKGAVLWGLCRLTGRSRVEAAQVALLLAQAGEFGFVLFGLANMAGVMDAELYQLLLLVIALSMVATPLMVMLGSRLEPIGSATPSPVVNSPSKPIPTSRNHVIIAGFGRFGGYLARVLAKAGIPYLALEVNPVRVARAQALGHPVFFGDASRVEVLRTAGAVDASILVFTLDQMETIGQTLLTVREAFPDLPIYTRAWDIKVARKLRSMGATYAIPETMATSLQLAGDLLSASGVTPEMAERFVHEIHDQEWRKVVKPPRLGRQVGFNDILLVLIPGVEEKAALQQAVTLAEDNRAALTVVEVLGEAVVGADRADPNVSSPDELEEEMAERRRRRLEALVTPNRDRVDIQIKVLVGRSHMEIAREVIANGRDLVLKAVEGGRSWRDRLFGDNDARLLKICPCPVLLIRTTRPIPHRYRRILVGVYPDEYPARQWDGRHALNRNILEHAAWLATAHFSELHVVYVWEAYGEQELRTGRSPFHCDVDAYVEREHKRNQEALTTLIAGVREALGNQMLAAFNPVTHLVKGSPQDEIIRRANGLDADLVVLGTAARSGITGLILESTAEAITKSLDCSVLVVKPPGFVTSVVVEELST